MRTIDARTNTEITGEPNLDAGYIIKTPWASPEKYDTINNTKFALDDSDYEIVQLYIRYDDEQLSIASIENPLAVTDAAICELYEMIGALNG
jgi:hypothetical protein